jgi:hypothetical protein
MVEINTLQGLQCSKSMIETNIARFIFGERDASATVPGAGYGMKKSG